MIKVKCIEKIRDKNNHIIGYKIIDKDKKSITVKSDALKRAIRLGQVDVVNLTLTSDNRLIDKKSDTHSKPVTTRSKQNINIESLLNRVITMGYIIKVFNTDCGHECYITSSPDNTKHLLLIPDDVKYIYKNDANSSDIFEKNIFRYMLNIRGTLKVVGGKNLISTYEMFYCCNAQSLDLRFSIDLSLFDTSRVTDMSYMFHGCQAQSIDLRSFDTSNVTDMSEMFSECDVQSSLDLSSFDTSKVTNMSGMFRECIAHSINLSSFDTSRVTNMFFMFSACKVQSLDLSSFNTSKVTNMNLMFGDCKAQSLNLSSFDTSNVTDMGYMFGGCEAQSLDLRSFNTSKVTDMQYMFCECKVQLLDLRSFNTSKVTNMRGMFSRCKAQSIDLSSFNTDNVTNMREIFVECKADVKVNDHKLIVQLQK